LAGKTLDLDRLGKGPKAFLKSRGRACKLRVLAEFLYDYVTRVEGRKKILKLLEKEKGAAYVPNLFVPTRAAYVVWKLEDMKPRWDRAFWLKTLTGDDLEMYRNRDTLPAEEKARFRTLPPVYTSGEGIKRERGKDLRSEECKARLEELNRLWTEGMGDVGCRNALAKVWKELTIQTRKLRAYELVEEEKVQELMGEGRGGEGDDGGAPEIVLPETDYLYMEMPPLEVEEGRGEGDLEEGDEVEKTPPRRARKSHKSPTRSPPERGEKRARRR